MAAPPTALFYGARVVHTRVESGATGIRQFGINGNLGEALAQGGRTIAAWLVPTTDPPTGLHLWIAAAAALIGCYVGVLIASRLTADAKIPFDERILAPFILLAPPRAQTGVVVARYARRFSLRRFGDTLARRGAVVIAFDAVSPDCVPPDSVAAIARLRTIARFADGTIYGPALRIMER